MSAKKEFLNFCRQIGGTSDAKKETIVCRFPEFHELQEIDVSSQEMTMKDRGGRKASLHVNRVVIVPSSIHYSVGDWLLDTHGGTLEGLFKITGMEADINKTDDELRIKLTDK